MPQTKTIQVQNPLRVSRVLEIQHIRNIDHAVIINLANTEGLNGLLHYANENRMDLLFRSSVATLTSLPGSDVQAKISLLMHNTYWDKP